MSAIDRTTPCGPDACFSMERMTPTDLSRLMQGAEALPYVTRPSGAPRHARHSDQGVTVGWSPRQQAAARRLEELWKEGRRGWTGPGGYRSGAGGGPAGDSDEELEAAGAAWRSFQEAAEAVERQCSPIHARALRMAVIEHQPSTLARADIVREALGFLADFWQLRP